MGNIKKKKLTKEQIILKKRYLKKLETYALFGFVAGVGFALWVMVASD
jgi:hypothetical protein